MNLWESASASSLETLIDNFFFLFFDFFVLLFITDEMGKTDNF